MSVDEDSLQILLSFALAHGTVNSILDTMQILLGKGEGGREGGRKGGKEGGRERGRKGKREGEKEGGREREEEKGMEGEWL